jgi:hypothetical protein
LVEWSQKCFSVKRRITERGGGERVRQIESRRRREIDRQELKARKMNLEIERE